MALKGSTPQERAYHFFSGKDLGPYGKYGIMGNIRAESAWLTKNLQNSYEKKSGFTDDTYTAAVDNGTYTRFTTDKYGYGYCQWTSDGRKANMLNFRNQRGVSIADEEMQLEFIMWELTGPFKGVLSKLKAAQSVQEASDIILTRFEMPADQGEGAKKTRGGYSLEYFNQFSGTGNPKVPEITASNFGVGGIIKVGSARIDERGKASGGAAGDQTGKEVCTQDYYVHSKGWYLFRAKDIQTANALASAMQDACDNDCIGYDQGQRITVIDELRKYGSMRKIKTRTEADCSSLVRGCCIEAGFDPGNFDTASEPAALEKTGRFEEKKTVTSSTELFNGDILVTKQKGHTVIVVSGNPRTASGSSQAAPAGAGAKPQTGAPAYKVGVTYTAQVELNVRTGPGTNYAKVGYAGLSTNAKQNDKDRDGAIDAGTRVTCQALKKDGNNIWMKIPSGWIAAYYSGKVYVS